MRKGIAKTFTALLIMLVAITGFNVPELWAASTPSNFEITVVYDGKPIVFSQPPLIRNGYAFYPLEDVLQAFCGGHEWNGQTFVVSGRMNGRTIEIPLRNLCYIANGTVLSVPAVLAPFVENERTYVYLDYIVESLGMSVSWDSNTKTIYVYSSSSGNNNSNSYIMASSYFADVPRDAPYAEAVSVLLSMGIISSGEFGYFYPEDTLTFKEFIVMLGQIIGESEAEAAFAFGSTSWNRDGRYDLVSFITYEHAITILINAIGYEDNANEIGSWPNGHLTFANEIGIIDQINISIGDYIPRSVTAQLLYNLIQRDNGQ